MTASTRLTVGLGAIAMGLLITPAAAAAPSADSGWAPADSAAIRPGVVTDTDGGGACTSNFVFTSGDRTFLGQAAHCGSTGGATESGGCDTESVDIGTPVTIRGTDGTERTGHLAYSSWVAMQAAGESDDDVCRYNDFALVEIADTDVSEVNPSLPVFGGPTGVDGDGLTPGEHVYSYGSSPLRLGLEALSPKVGTAAAEDGAGRRHDVYTLTPGIPGDSGSGFTDSAGAAVGVLSTLNLASRPLSNGIADLDLALAYAAAHGQVGDVELVRGTEPFDPSPIGVAPDELAAPRL